MTYVDGTSGPAEELPSYLVPTEAARRSCVRDDPVSLLDLAARHGQRIAELGRAVRHAAAAALPTGLFVTLHTSTIVITRTVRIPTTVAADAVARWRGTLDGATVDLPLGRATLGPLGRDARQPSVWRAETSITGIRHLRPVALELTVGPWTQHATQIDLRPPRFFRPTRRYFALGHGLLDAVVQTVLAPDGDPVLAPDGDPVLAPDGDPGRTPDGARVS